MFNDDDQTMTENQWNIEVPLLVRLRWEMGKITPYAYGGPSVNYTFSAKADLELIDRVTETVLINGEPQISTSEIPVNGPAVDIMDQRVNLNTNVIVGGGVMIRMKYDFIVVDLRYRGGLNNIVDEKGHYLNNELVYRYGYVDDYKRLNNLAITVGYVKPFYKPRKRKKFRK
jgi:hypothetical protein